MTDTEKYPLPAGQEDGVLNRSQLAVALRTSENTIDRYRKEGMPVLEEGTNGQAYSFKLSECYAWICERDDSRKAAKVEADRIAAQMAMNLVGGSVGEGDMSLSVKERRENYELTVSYDKLALERGKLLLVEDVASLLDDVLSLVRTGISGLPDRLSRDAGLTGRQIEQAVVVTDDLLADLHARLDQYIQTDTEAVPVAAE